MILFTTSTRAAAAAAALILAVVAGAPAHESTVGAITVTHPWMRATPPGASVAGGYAEIRNDGSEPDRLVGGAVPFAGRVEVHEMSMEGDVMRMRKLEDGLEIPAGSTVVLKPGSFHIMFLGLTASPAVDDLVEGTLTFEKAGDVTVEFQVAPVGATEPHGSH